MKIRITKLPKFQSRGLFNECPNGYIDDGFGNCIPDLNNVQSNAMSWTPLSQGNVLSGVAQNPMSEYMWNTSFNVPRRPSDMTPATTSLGMVQDEAGNWVYPEQLNADNIWMGQGVGSKGQPILGTTNAAGQKVGGPGAVEQPFHKSAPDTGVTKKTKTRKDNSYGMAVAGAMNTGLSMVNTFLKDYQEAVDLNANKRLIGQTDANQPVVKNVYSRGRNVMNAPAGAEYAPNMMTPIQFAGRPTTEFTGYPNFRYSRPLFAQDGLATPSGPNINIAEDVLGMASLTPNAAMYNMPVEPAMPAMLSEAPAASEDVASASGEFVLPVKDFKITSGFGRRQSPKKGASSEHNGVDLAVPENTAVFAPMDGVVEKIYENQQGGKQLVIKHSDGSRSGFAHLNGYSIKLGDAISKGQQVGLSGSTGISTGPHLHFTYKNAAGQFIDPVDFFNMRGTSKSKDVKGLSNWDHNNPGNIHAGNFAQKYNAVPGRKDNAGRVAVFPSMDAGLKAMEDLLFSSGYSNLTISEARNKWVNGKASVYTPSSKNIVEAVGADVPLNQLSPQQRKRVLSEFIKWEDRSVYDKLRKQGLFQEGGVVENNNSMKIRITKAPSSDNMFADGGKTVGDQMGYGLYRGQSVRDFNAFNKTDEDNYDENVRSSEGGVPRSMANIEAEKGEKKISPDGLHITDILGKKHSEGGTPMDAQPGSYIVSDFIVAPKSMQAAMGFEVPSKRKKDNTWSKVLDSKVKSKDFNRLSQIVQAAASGKEVDPFELATAQSKLPVYQDYVSKAALGNELTKMMQGKPYEIPDIAIPAFMKMFPEQAQEMMAKMMPNQDMEQVPNMTPPDMARDGKYIPKYQQRPGTVEEQQAPAWKGFPYPMPPVAQSTPNDPLGLMAGINTAAQYPWFVPFRQSKTKAGRITRGGKNLSSLYDPSNINQYQDLDYWANLAESQGQPLKSKQDLQRFIYRSLAADPRGKQALETMWTNYGPTLKSDEMNEENFAEGNIGARTAFAMAQRLTPQASSTTIPVTPGVTPTSTPTTTPTATQKTIDQKKPVENVTPDWSSGEGIDLRKLPYTQDIINLGYAAANMGAYPNIGPWQARYNAVYMDPAFISTEATDRMLQAQGKTAMEDASLYAGAPQVQAARQAQINAQVMPGMIQNRMQTNAQNIQSDMATRQFNTQVANQAAMLDAQMATQLSDKNAQFAMNKAKEKVLGRKLFKDALNTMITNAGDTYLMNQWYPQYAFNPLNYETYFKRGMGNTLETDAATDGSSLTSNLAAARNYAKSLGITSGPELNEAIMDYMEFASGKPSRRAANPYGAMAGRRGRVSPNFNSMDPATMQQMMLLQQQGMMMNGGSYVPMYYVGGWY